MHATTAATPSAGHPLQHLLIAIFLTHLNNGLDALEHYLKVAAG